MASTFELGLLVLGGLLCCYISGSWLSTCHSRSISTSTPAHTGGMDSFANFEGASQVSWPKLIPVPSDLATASAVGQIVDAHSMAPRQMAPSPCTLQTQAKQPDRVVPLWAPAAPA